MIDFIKGMLFVRKCLICGEAMPNAKENTVFCSKCLLEYEKLGRAKCKKCGKQEKECRCVPEKLRGKVSFSVHLFAFESELSRTILYSLKQRNIGTLQNFLADELEKALLRVIPREELKEYSVTYAPRKPKSVREYGFDQAEILAERLSERLDIPMADMFVHARFSALQKYLNAEEREHNAKKSYSLRCGFSPETEKLLILDDVMTTGSTLSCLVSLAKEIGYREIAVIFVAKTTRGKEKDNS